jgi:hypothetical protein
MAAKTYHLDKFHIISSTESIVDEILRLSKGMNEERFFHKNGKWSVAENIEHLRISFFKSWQGLFLPKFIIRLQFGKPDHESIPYEELMEVYNQKLVNGAMATKTYIPKINTTQTSKEKIIEDFERSITRYLNEIRYYWEDHHIDKYQLPHPLLGKITARELMYFNIFHCWHHFRTLRQRNSEAL